MTTDDYRWLQMITDDYRWLQMITDDYRWLQMVTDDYRWLQMVTDDYRWLQMITKKTTVFSIPRGPGSNPLSAGPTIARWLARRFPHRHAASGARFLEKSTRNVPLPRWPGELCLYDWCEIMYISINHYHVNCKCNISYRIVDKTSASDW